MQGIFGRSSTDRSNSDDVWVTDPLSLWSSAVGTLIADVAALGLAIAFTSPVSVAA